MTNFCPEWIFGICCAKTAEDFLATNNSILSISKKFSTGLSEKYNEIKVEEIQYVAQKILEFLSEVNASDEAVNIINDYIFLRTNFLSNGGERKIDGIFSSALDGEKKKDFDVDKTFKIFRATFYSIRNGISEKSTPGWVLTDKDDIDWLGDLFTQDTAIF